MSLQKSQTTTASSISSSFLRKKTAILKHLSVPEGEYTDASPKGTVDAGIRSLIDEINARDGLVTTSSCAGRVSVYLEGRKKEGENVITATGTGTEAAAAAATEVFPAGESTTGKAPGEEEEEEVEAEGDGGEEDDDEKEERGKAGVGGKGGGEWLFVSHEPFPSRQEGGESRSSYLMGVFTTPSPPPPPPPPPPPRNKAATAAGGGSERERSGNAGEDDAGREGASPSAKTKTKTKKRLIHFKFEPMILHILTASLHHAQQVIQAGISAGFRETGAVSLLGKQQSDDEAATPMVAIRSMGLSFESLIGYEYEAEYHEHAQDRHGAADSEADREEAETKRKRERKRVCLVPPEYLTTLVEIANERFAENEKRIARFQTALNAIFSTTATTSVASAGKRRGGGGQDWEDAETRRQRKREEGLRRREEEAALKKEEEEEKEGEEEDEQIDLGAILLQDPDVL